MARYAREKNRIMMLKGCTSFPPVMPLRMTLHGIHCAAFRMKTMMTGAVARFRGRDNFSLRTGARETVICARGMDTALMTKTIGLL